MRNVLLILSQDPVTFWPFSETQDFSDQIITVLLIQKAVLIQSPLLQGKHYVLKENGISGETTSLFPTVTYHDMLQMIFDADSVIVL